MDQRESPWVKFATKTWVYKHMAASCVYHETYECAAIIHIVIPSHTSSSKLKTEANNI